MGKRVQKQPICGVLGNIDPINYPLQSLLYAGVMEASILRNVPTLTIPPPSDRADSDGPGEMIANCDKSREFDLKGVFIINPEYYFLGIELAEAFPQKRFFLLNYEMDDFRRMPDNMAAVINDNYGGACRLACRVFGQYRPKTVSFLTLAVAAENDITYTERERGVRDTAKATGIKVMPTMNIPRSDSPEDQIDFAYAAALKSLKSKKTDFIFSANDQLALGARRAVEELELHTKTGIAGYDGITVLPGRGIPTVKVSYTEMGKTGLAEMLDPEFRMPQVIKLQPEIVMHGGTED